MGLAHTCTKTVPVRRACGFTLRVVRSPHLLQVKASCSHRTSPTARQHIPGSGSGPDVGGVAVDIATSSNGRVTDAVKKHISTHRVVNTPSETHHHGALTRVPYSAVECVTRLSRLPILWFRDMFLNIHNHMDRDTTPTHAKGGEHHLPTALHARVTQSSARGQKCDASMLLGAHSSL